MNMFLIGRSLAGIVALFLLFIGLRYTFTPDALTRLTALTANDAFGASNIRAMGAPMLALGIVTGIGAVKGSYAFLVPAPVYFLMLILTRIVSIASEGSDPNITRALILAVILFVMAEVAVQITKRAVVAKSI